MMLPPASSLIMSQLDLNEDQVNHQFSSPNHNYASSSSFSSLSYPNLFYPPDQHQQGSYYSEPNNLPNHYEEAEKIIPSSDSWDHSAGENHHSRSKLNKLTVWKKEESRDDENLQAADQDGSSSSVKWMSSKMRIMRKMMVSDQTVASHIAASKFEDQKQPLCLSPLGTDNSSNNYSNHHSNNNNITVRVCSDCHTTKTPLWRSGPRGPKTLCNACGIRQRKARRAMAAAAAASSSANGTIVMAAGETSVKRNKFQKKEKKSKIESATHDMNKKKHKLGTEASQSRKKFGFEDLRLSLSKNLAVQQVFPQDEREAAILLMALSYGLVC